MRKLYIVAVLAMLMALPAAANAEVRERTLTGAAIGVGAVIVGPRVTYHRHCWRDPHGYLYCRD